MHRGVFLFPGQGSQSVGMMDTLASSHAVIREVFEQGSDALGQDLWRLCAEGPEDQLNRTEYTQPAMLAAGIATWRLWQLTDGPAPGMMAGHSLGEYSALVAAGALSFEDGIRTVALRGRLMQEAAPQGVGAMAAVLGLDDRVLADLCEEVAGGQVVSCANFNSPGQVVIAGHREAVERACERAREAGARRALLLPVSVPSHCELMKPAAERLAEALADIELRVPVIPVIHNADVAAHDSAEAIRDALTRQLFQPVRWTETIRHLAAVGYSRFYECGPGKVLAGLNRRIERDLSITALTEPAAFETALEELEHE